MGSLVYKYFDKRSEKTFLVVLFGDFISVGCVTLVPWPLLMYWRQVMQQYSVQNRTLARRTSAAVF